MKQILRFKAHFLVQDFKSNNNNHKLKENKAPSNNLIKNIVKLKLNDL